MRIRSGPLAEAGGHARFAARWQHEHAAGIPKFPGNYAARLLNPSDLAFFRGRGKECGPLLLNLRAAALGALHLVLVVFGNGLSEGELFVAAGATVFVLRHDGLLRRGAKCKRSLVHAVMQWLRACKAIARSRRRALK